MHMGKITDNFHIFLSTSHEKIYEVLLLCCGDDTQYQMSDTPQLRNVYRN